MAIETSSKVSIISNALVLAGELPCESLSEDRYGVTVGANLFENIYEAELQSNRWRFSMKLGSLSRLVVTPLTKWQYAYQIPTDCLLIIGMLCPQPYEIYGDRIYTNATTVEMEYQFKPEINRLPAYFTLLLTYALAKDAITPITENDARVAIMTRKYISQRDRALFADAQARPSTPIVHSPFTDVRG